MARLKALYSKIEKTKITTIAVHLAGWLLFMAFPMIFLNAGQSDKGMFGTALLSKYLVFIGCYALLFYLNNLYLIPSLFMKRKYLAYVLSISVLFAGVHLLKPFHELLTHDSFQAAGEGAGTPDGKGPDIGPLYPQPQGPLAPPHNGDGPPMEPPPGRERGHDNFLRTKGTIDLPPPIYHTDMTAIFLFVVILALSTSAAMTREWRVTRERAALAEAEKANAELSFLKAQINPHFLFNTLNNIYTLAVISDEHTAESIMKLSNIMRYVTDEVSENVVPLEKEIDCITNYIDLQRLRTGEGTEIDYSVTGDTSNKLVAPLIFMTFIENVFKYGISKQEHSKLIIRINISGNKVNLFCRNPVYDTIRTDTRRGIGIENTRQRLEHLYQGNYSLAIEDQKDLFTVDLKLNMQE